MCSLTQSRDGHKRYGTGVRVEAGHYGAGCQGEMGNMHFNQPLWSENVRRTSMYSLKKHPKQRVSKEYFPMVIELVVQAKDLRLAKKKKKICFQTLIHASLVVKIYVFP